MVDHFNVDALVLADEAKLDPDRAEHEAKLGAVEDREAERELRRAKKKTFFWTLLAVEGSYVSLTGIFRIWGAYCFAYCGTIFVSVTISVCIQLFLLCVLGNVELW